MAFPLVARAFAIFVCLLFGYPSSHTHAHAQTQATLRRDAKIAWRAMENTPQYDLELSQSAEMDPVVFRKTLEKTEITLKLKPGTYFFRIRGKSKTGTAGPWSEVQGFVVNPEAPTPLEPKPNSVFKDELPQDGIHFQWKAATGAAYKIEIHDAKGILLDRHLNDSSFHWYPSQSGDFKWRTGFVTAAGVEWSALQAFRVEDKALKNTKTVFIRRDEITETTSAEVYLILRGGQALFTFVGSDDDLNVTSFKSFGGAGFFGGELRWRLARTTQNPWMLSGALNGEIVTQTIQTNSFSLPRGFMRVFITKRTGSWRWGPFIHLGVIRMGGFITDQAPGTPSTRLIETTRFTPGVGIAAVYDASSTLLFSVIALGRYDFGGQSPTSNPTLPTYGMEAGFGAVLGLSSHFSAEVRLRAIVEEFKWGLATSTIPSAFQNQYYLLDMGIGYRF